MSKNQIILVMTDTQRYDMIGKHNDTINMRTPNLDRLVNTSVSCNRAYTTQPVCGPARSAIFTGTFPHQNGMYANSLDLGESVRTVGERLEKNNIQSAYIGKWHLDGGDYFGNGICPKGWNKDYWFDMRNFLDEMSDEDKTLSRRFASVFEKDGVMEDFTYANKCTNRAIDFIENHKDEDFFLVVSYDEPHDPFIAPKEFFKNFENVIFNKENCKMSIDNFPEHIKIWAELNKDFNAYEYTMGLLGCNSYVDYEMGRLFEKVESDIDTATIIYTSDHGDSMGSHNIFGKGPAMYDEITKIPFIIKEGVNSKPMSFDGAISHIDIVPSVLDFFNIDKPMSLYGNSFLPTEKLFNREENKAFMEFTRYEIDHDGFGGFQPVRAVVKNDYKLIISLLTSDELYNLKDDPNEIKNLILDESYRHIRNELHDDILNFMDETRDIFRGYYWENRPWRRDAPTKTWRHHGMTRQKYTEDDEVRQLDYNTGLEIKEFARQK